ncbi:MAG: hypothetical protein OES32_12955 [Acidobacteriota bacterium]|nr:hypothetical protein [Acidobacteriota bacterium]MDH3524487.1 hypothetical protein [Acidobacteriota bacterium]
MKTIRNTTHRPLKVHLSQDKVLHLGPGREGHISTPDLERTSVQQLLAAGEVEIVGEGEVPGPLHETGHVHADTRGHHPDLTVRKRGER